MSIKIKNPLTEAYKITSGYGKRTLNGKVEIHKGLDLIGAVTGKTAVINCFYGRAKVVRSYFSQTGGNSVILEHYTEDKERLISLYCHLEKRMVSLNEIVEENQVIGIMGNTGASKGIHLHFQLHYDKSNHQDVNTYFNELGNLNPAEYMDK